MPDFLIPDPPMPIAVHRLPDPRRRRGALERRDAERRQHVRIALVIAGKAATAPASPQPFTPSGLVVQRVPSNARSNDGRSSARGIA